MPRGAAGAAEADPVGRNSTADRAIDVLLLFDEQHGSLSASEIAERLGMSRSTTYRYLQSLRAYGFLEEVEHRGGFRLGPRIFQLARIARAGLGLVDLALPLMKQLADETGEVVLLTRRAGRQVVCVERVDSDVSHPIRLSYERGQTLPLHAGASAKVLLAFATPEETDEVLAGAKLERFTDNTVTGQRELRAQLAEIREQGYAISRGEVDPGAIGIAAPVFGRTGTIEAGVSVAGPIFRLAEDRLPDLIAAVYQCAEGITLRIREVEG